MKKMGQFNFGWRWRGQDFGVREYISNFTFFRSAIGRSFNRRDDIRLGKPDYLPCKFDRISLRMDSIIGGIMQQLHT